MGNYSSSVDLSLSINLKDSNVILIMGLNYLFLEFFQSNFIIYATIN